MKSVFRSLLFVAAVTLAVAAAAEDIARPGETRYRVTVELYPGDDPALVARQLSGTYRGRLVRSPDETGAVFVIDLSDSAARLLRADPRVVRVEALDADTNASAGTWSTGTYNYDGAGNIKSIGTVEKYSYDAFGRLTKATIATGNTQAFTYDVYGNVLTVTTDNNTSAAAKLGVDPATNRITRATNPATGDPYNAYGTYDQAGNMTGTSTNDTFAWDGLGMMTDSKVQSVRKVYLYTPDDERLASISIENGAETRSDWTLRGSGGEVLRRYAKTGSGTTATWAWDQDYVYAGGRLLASDVREHHKRLHFHLDHLGTPRLITGSGGAEIARHTYYPFGEEVTAWQEGEPRKFTGHERDASTLDYMHARSYLPMWGRFLSVDPMMASADPRLPQSWNRYTYALNNALKFIDPTGKNAVVTCDPDNNCTATVDAQIVANPNDPAQIAAAIDFRNGAINYWQGRQAEGPNGEAITFQVNIAIVAPGDALDGVDTLTVVSGAGRSNVQMSLLHGGDVSPFDTGTIFTTDITGNPSGMAGIAAHETGHLFGLRDLYAIGERVPSWNSNPTENIMRYAQPTNGAQTAFWVLNPNNGNVIVLCVGGPC